jgi:hypothetical protein
MTVEGVDFSWARPGGQALVDAHKHFVVRYVPYAGDGGKGLTKAEIADYRAHGLAICLVFESLAGRALTAGLAGGAADAKTSQSALVALGMPRDLPIYFAVDRDVDASHQPAIDAYLNGAAGILTKPRVGVYGEASLVKRCKANGTAAWLWQTYAWSNSVIASGIHLYQYKNGQIINGGAVDFTRAMQAEYGQWSAPLPDSSTEAPLATITITTLPFGGGYVIPAGKSVTAVQFDANGAVTATKVWEAVPIDASANYDATVSNTAVRGNPFLRCTNGHFAPDANGPWYLSAGQVDETPGVAPADTTPLTQAQLDAAVLASRAYGYPAGRADGTTDEKARVRSILGL